MNLRNKIAIITGAGSGIGRETAIELARHGCTPVLVGRREKKLAEVLNEVWKYAPASTAETCDICEGAHIKQVVQAICERHGGIDILINNAGVMIVKAFDELSQDEFNMQMDTNFYGAVSLIRAVIPVMQKQGRGVIINVTSSDSKLVVPGTNAYAASKAALNALSESLYYELKDKGIHVGLVLPGGTSTELFDSVVNKLGEYYRDQSRMSPAKVARSIREAIEKERFETVTPFSDRVYIGFRNALPGVFRTFVLRRLSPYLGK